MLDINEYNQNQKGLVERWYEEVKAQQEELQKTKDKLEEFIRVGRSIESEVMSYCEWLKDEGMWYTADNVERTFLYELRNLLPPLEPKFSFIALPVPNTYEVYLDKERVALLEDKSSHFTVIFTTDKHGDSAELNARIVDAYTTR